MFRNVPVLHTQPCSQKARQCWAFHASTTRQEKVWVRSDWSRDGYWDPTFSGRRWLRLPLERSREEPARRCSCGSATSKQAVSRVKPVAPANIRFTNRALVTIGAGLRLAAENVPVIDRARLSVAVESRVNPAPGEKLARNLP